jgi:hypothetical protein
MLEACTSHVDFKLTKHTWSIVIARNSCMGEH